MNSHIPITQLQQLTHGKFSLISAPSHYPAPLDEAKAKLGQSFNFLSINILVCISERYLFFLDF